MDQLPAGSIDEIAEGVEMAGPEFHLLAEGADVY
jgi:hypothetical protein